MKKIKEHSGIQQLVKVIKEVTLFLYLVIPKLLQRPKQDPVQIQPNSKNNNSGHLKTLLKLLFKGIRSSVNIGSKEIKEVSLNEIRAKKKRKTWARVKQDCKEWYASILEEYEAKKKG